MWVADMDFKAAPFILDALRKRVEHGVFGYVHVPDSYYDAVIEWFRRRRGWEIRREWIQYIGGIVPAISVVVASFTEKGDNVLINAPAYNCFYSCVRNCGCNVLENKLLYNAEEHSFSLDSDDLERKCSDPRTKIFLFCNPHNPSGRIWTKEELERVGEICRAHGVMVVSDEIHCEIEMPGHTFTPFAAVSPENQDCCITFNSPTKSFNLAGLQISNIITPHKEWRDKIDRTLNVWEHCDLNPFGVDALQAAYTEEGEKWLREMNSVVYSNYQLLRDTLAKEVPECPVCRLEGTYLAWVDCMALTSRGISTNELSQELIKEEKVWINSGTMYGDGDFVRINLACPPARMQEGTSRIIRGIKRLLQTVV